MSAKHSASALAFEIKSGAVHLPILKLLDNDVARIAAQLRDKVGQAPDFFRHAPMAIDLHDLPEADMDFRALVQAMRSLGLVPVGVGGGSERQLHAARVVGLSLLTLSRHDAAAHKVAEPKPAEPKPAEPEPELPGTKTIDQPVRSGQRIYAPGGDLIVLAPVSAGAEIMADGNIHVYSVLRGRALAGVQGNLSCRIFCHDLQAELVSVGGHYKISENFDDAVRGRPVQIYLKNNALLIDKI